MSSEIPKAHHTPIVPIKRLNIKAAGIIKIKYRKREITRDGIPIPKPSKAPQEVTETDETINPVLIIRSAVVPAWIVSIFEVNRLISCVGIRRHKMVPNTIMIVISDRAVVYIFLTLLYSPAP